MGTVELANEMVKLGHPKTKEAHISIWENEKSVPSSDRVDALKEALKLKSTDYFYQEHMRD